MREIPAAKELLDKNAPADPHQSAARASHADSFPQGKPYFLGIVMVSTIWSSVSFRSEIAEMPLRWMRARDWFK